MNKQPQVFIPATQVTEVIHALKQEQVPQSHPIGSNKVLINILLYNYTLSFVMHTTVSRKSLYDQLITRIRALGSKVFINFNSDARAISLRFSSSDTPQDVIHVLQEIHLLFKRPLPETVVKEMDLLTKMMEANTQQGISTLSELLMTERGGNALGLRDGIHTTIITIVDQDNHPIERIRVIYRGPAYTHDYATKCFLAVVSGHMSVARDDLTQFQISVTYKDAVIRALQQYGMMFSTIPPFGKATLIQKGSCIFGSIHFDNKVTKLNCKEISPSLLN